MTKSINIQDTFLNQMRKENIPATIFLVNGFQIRGTVKHLIIIPLLSTVTDASK